MTRNLQNNVSIRLMSGGHAFSKQELDAALRADSECVIEIVTPKTTLRPVEGFNPMEAYRDLEAVGYSIAEDEVVVCSPEIEGRVAIMTLCRECAELIAGSGAKICYTSPLIMGEEIDEGSHIALYGNVLYVRVYRDGLRFAEAIAVESDADILYYLESIERVYGICNMYARAMGDVERLAKICGRYTKLKF
ncbi:MAG: hypothetical protein J6U82_03090 [Alistipes sp.]|nr:hypothetical protein [Alistipes sp.]